MQKAGVLRDMAGCTKRSWPLAIEGIRYPVSGRGMTGGEKSWRPERSQAKKATPKSGLFSVRPAGRIYLEVKVLYSPDKGKS
jgi:hypothetical protein